MPRLAARLADGHLRWDVYGAGGVITTGYGDLDVDDFYDELDQVATTA